MHRTIFHSSDVTTFEQQGLDLCYLEDPLNEFNLGKESLPFTQQIKILALMHYVCDTIWVLSLKYRRQWY